MFAVIVFVASSFFQPPFDVAVPRVNGLVYNHSDPSQPSVMVPFTGFNVTTLRDNLFREPPIYSTFLWTSIACEYYFICLAAKYVVDYESRAQMNFVIIFAVLFSGVTGIMNGANMSGRSICPWFSHMCVVTAVKH